MESTKEKLEKSIKRLNSLVETASKCGDNGLEREAKSKLALYNSILQDLERLEQLEKENESLKRARDTIIINSRNTINELSKYIEELENDNKELRKAVKSWSDSIPKLIKENIKLKTTIDILKEKPEILMIRLASFYQCDYDENYFAEYFVYDSEGDDIRTLIYITKEQYELLKEVLDNDK